jgi:hypothetical protein
MDSVIRSTQHVALFQDASEARGAARRLINGGISPFAVSLLEPGALRAQAEPHAGRALFAGAILGAIEGAGIAYALAVFPQATTYFNSGAALSAAAGAVLGLCAGGLLGILMGGLRSSQVEKGDSLARADWPAGTLLYIAVDSRKAATVEETLAELGAVNFTRSDERLEEARPGTIKPPPLTWDETEGEEKDFLGRPRHNAASSNETPVEEEALVTPLAQDSWPERRLTHGRRKSDRPTERRAGHSDRRQAPKLH